MESLLSLYGMDRNLIWFIRTQSHTSNKFNEIFLSISTHRYDVLSLGNELVERFKEQNKYVYDVHNVR